MANRFILSHKMMSICLLDANFYEVAATFKAVRELAQREWETRKAGINSGAKKGCSSCGKKRAARVRAEMEKRHGAIFSQLLATTVAGNPQHRFIGVYNYVKTHLHVLTGKKDLKPDFTVIVAYIPVKGPGGTIEVVEKEL